MPNTKGAEKAMRVSQRRRTINSLTVNKYKDAVKTVRKAVVAGDKAAAQKALPNAFKQLDKAAKKEVIHKNKAARLKSRLNSGIEKLK